MTKIERPIPHAARRLLCAQVLGIYLAMSWAPAALAAPTTPPASLAQVPQFLPTPPAPNIVVTLDDSGSMTQAFVPDGLDQYASTRRFKSSKFNPLYYDPDTVYPPPVDSSGTPLSTTFACAWINGFADGVAGRPNNGCVNLASGYRPTVTYSPASTDQSFADHASADLLALNVSKKDSPGPAYYYRFDPTPANNCDGTVGNDDCYRLVIVSATSGTNPLIGPDERQNFANWYSYYRTRNLLTVTAATRTFASLTDEVRVAWQGLTTCDAFSSTCSGWTRSGVSFTAVPHVIRRWVGTPSNPADATHKNNFYRWVMRLPASGFTPLRTAMSRAGSYLTTSGNDSPWGVDPNQSEIVNGTEHACRRSFHILMTDGFWNSDKDVNSPNFCGGAACGNRDATAGTLPDGTAYDTTSALTRIYRDDNAHSLADVAFHYWATDLRPDLANIVPPYYADRSGTAAEQYWNPKNDPATWQHMVNFTIGLGLTGSMNFDGLQWAGGTYSGAAYENLRSGARSWPATGDSSTWKAGSTTQALGQGRVYDLWHAAINSRGMAFSAERPAEIQQALARVLREILQARSGSAALPGSNSAFLDDGSSVFTPEFTQGEWSGDLYRREIDPATLQYKTFGGVPWRWRASDQLPAPNARRIFTLREDGSRVEFLPQSGSAGVSSLQMDALSANPSATAADVIDYLRGDRSKEMSATPPGVLRDRPRVDPGDPASRNNVLGTIINSAPLYVKDDDFALDLLPTGTPGRDTYQAFVRANAGVGGLPGRTPLIWVGSNGGMFHAFNADTGVEVFAYVPRSIIRNLPELTKPDYQHRYFVDGVPASGDAYIAPGGFGSPSWRTVVIGSLGAGGRSVFAIDATDPAALGAGSILWDMDERSLSLTDYEYLGHVFGPAFTARAKNGKWVAVFGNGPESDRKSAALFIVDLETGAPIRIIDTGDGSNGNPNGLSTPAPVFDANQQLIAVYAGDLRGNLWKFDLSSTNEASWDVAFGGNPLFKARNLAGQRQPIFARPLLRRHPNGGTMVIFGTGKLFSPGDKDNTDVQTLYGVWDKPSAPPLDDNFRSGSEMVQQAIKQKDVFDPALAGDEPTNYRLTNFPVNYGAGKRGWYLDLGVQYGVAGTSVNTASATVVTPRERMVIPPIQLGINLLAQSFVPSTDPCSPGGDSFLYRLDPLTGSFFGERSFGDVDSGAIQVPGSFGLLPFYSRTASSAPPGSGGTQPPPPPSCPPGATCTCPPGFDYVFSTGIDGSISGRCVPRGGIGAMRTWRQIIQ